MSCMQCGDACGDLVEYSAVGPLSCLLSLPLRRRTMSRTKHSKPPRHNKGSTKAKRSRGDEDNDEDEEGDEATSGEEDDDDGSDDQDEGELTGHGVHSRRMKGKISDQERELLAEKPWALRGEVHSHDRPQNR